MNKTKALTFAFSVLLSGIDIFVAFFLLLGGWNLTNSHPVSGYICIGLGPTLFFLSWGLWTNRILKLIGRLALYWMAVALIGVSVFPHYFTKFAHRSSDDWIGYGTAVLILLTALLSTLHLRFIGACDTTREEDGNDQNQPG